MVALTGAGCSTESGIPDYRGGGRPAPRNPIQHDAFMRRADVRRRYWARATLGWERFSGAQPNPAHAALAALEAAEQLAGVITQNVDRLHQRAGSRRVVELHGALADVACLRCGAGEARGELQARLLAANPDWLSRASQSTSEPWQGSEPPAMGSHEQSSRSPDAEVKPDGDADLDPALVETFQVVGCHACDGDLKPNVVFFGGTVSEPTLAAAWDLFDHAEVLLVAGSSLAVYSGYRFVRRAHERGIPIAVVNLGPTRADEFAAARVSAPVGHALPKLAAALAAGSAAG